MVEPLVEPIDKLTAEDLKAIPPSLRGKFMEKSILELINVNGNRGLSVSEIEKVTRYPKNTMLKHIELLFAKRKIHRISRGKFGLYYPNGQISSEKQFRDIMYGKNDDQRYGFKIISNVNGNFVHIQERELDVNGFPDDIGGVMIPVELIPKMINILLSISNTSEIILKKTGGKN